MTETTGAPILVSTARFPHFDQPWWNIYQAIVSIAIGTKEAVEVAGRDTGPHHFMKIDNTPTPMRRMSAREAQDVLGKALSGGLVESVRLDNIQGGTPGDGNSTPLSKTSWIGVEIDLSAGGLHWLRYQFWAADIRKLSPRAEPDQSTDPAGPGVDRQQSAVASPAAKTRRAKGKITGPARILAVFVDIEREGKDPAKMNRGALYGIVLEREEKNGKAGLGERTFQSALAAWAKRPKPSD